MVVQEPRTPRSPEESLSRNVSRGALWTTIAIAVTRTCGFLSAIILARLLVPSDFGLMAIAIAIISFTQGATETGFASALIQRQDRVREYFNTVWTTEVLRSVVIAVSLFLGAPLLAAYFGDPRVVPILRVLSLSIIIQGARNVGVITFRKEFLFHKQFVLEIVPQVINLVAVVSLSYVLRNVWGLVWATLVTSFVSFLVSYAIYPYRPALEFDRAQAKELIGFGKWILGQSLIVLFLDQAVTMFIGRFYGISNLGLYNRAVTFSSVMLLQITTVLWQVGYPMFAKIQSDPERLKRAFLGSAYLFYLVGVPMAGGLCVLAGDFVHIILTDKWLQIVPLMRLLSVQAAILVINAPSMILFQAIGKPGIGAKITTLTLVLTFATIYPASEWLGMQGTISALMVSNLLVSPIIWYFGGRVTKCSLGEFVSPIVFAVGNTVLMAVVLLVVRRALPASIGVVGFLGLVFGGAVCVLGISFAADKVLGFGVYGLIEKRVAALGGQ